MNLKSYYSSCCSKTHSVCVQCTFSITVRCSYVQRSTQKVCSNSLNQKKSVKHAWFTDLFIFLRTTCQIIVKLCLRLIIWHEGWHISASDLNTHTHNHHHTSSVDSVIDQMNRCLLWKRGRQVAKLWGINLEVWNWILYWLKNESPSLERAG